MLFRTSPAGTGGQAIEAVLTESETTFISRVAFPQLDAMRDDRTLEKLADVFWNLCLSEQQRATSLDVKAAALTGLSSLAAAVIAAASVSGARPSHALLVGRCVSIGLFVVTVLLSLHAQRVAKYGGFLDADLFDALGAHKEPVGPVPLFADADPHRCFLRELSLQRWLVYRCYCDGNDRKARRLGLAQASAALAVGSLVAALVTAFL